jgi:hypothetical protein
MMHREGLNLVCYYERFETLPKAEIDHCWNRRPRDSEAAETAAMDENGLNQAIRTSVSRLKNAH